MLLTVGDGRVGQEAIEIAKETISRDASDHTLSDVASIFAEIGMLDRFRTLLSEGSAPSKRLEEVYREARRRRQG
jgi:D-alanyl-D-alanine carboxypeptidase